MRITPFQRWNPGREYVMPGDATFAAAQAFARVVEGYGDREAAALCAERVYWEVLEHGEDK